MPEGKEEEQEIENLFEKIMKVNFPNLVKEIDLQFQEAQGVLNKLDPKRSTPRYIIIKMAKVKDKERILKAARGKETVTYKGVPIRLSADFSKETLQARRGLKEVFKVMKGKDLYPRLLYPAKLSFRMEGQVKCFPHKVKLKEFITTKPLLYEMLKGLILEIRGQMPKTQTKFTLLSYRTCILFFTFYFCFLLLLAFYYYYYYFISLLFGYFFVVLDFIV